MGDFLQHLAIAATSRQDEEKHMRRKERNRQSAAISRKRQQDHRALLEDENMRLQEENAKLRRMLHEAAPHIQLPVDTRVPAINNDTASDSDSSSSTKIEAPSSCPLPRVLLPACANAQSDIASPKPAEPSPRLVASRMI